MSLPVTAAAQTGISREQFDEILDRITREYAGEIAALGGHLVIERKWTDATVNAYASREGADWILTMYGGVARHPQMTYDAFMGIACHEMGHQLGGAPIFSDDEEWATVEGGADYYATLKCLRRVFRDDDNEKILGQRQLDPTAVAACAGQHSGKQDRLLCLRAAMAGLTLGAVDAAIGDSRKVPKLDSPDKRRVRHTFEDHPRSQCRVDTYFEGALCRVPWGQAMSNGDYRIGSCADARTYARGLRPRCWFAP